MEKCDTCFYFKKGNCRAKNIKVSINQNACVFYLINWQKRTELERKQNGRKNLHTKKRAY